MIYSFVRQFGQILIITVSSIIAMSSRQVRRNVAVFVAVVLLIVGGTAILSFSPEGPPSTTVASSSSRSTHTNSTIGVDAMPGTLSSFQTYSALHQFIT